MILCITLMFLFRPFNKTAAAIHTLCIFGGEERLVRALFNMASNIGAAVFISLSIIFHSNFFKVLADVYLNRDFREVRILHSLLMVLHNNFTTWGRTPAVFITDRTV